MRSEEPSSSSRIRAALSSDAHCRWVDAASKWARSCRIFLTGRNIPISGDVSRLKLPHDAAHALSRRKLMKINKLLAASVAVLALVSTAVAQEKSTAPARETTATTEKIDLKSSWRA